MVRGLYLVQGVVERRNTLPILANVLIEPTNGGLALTATDMEVGLRNTVQADVKKKGTVTLNARKLYEIVREMTADEVVLRSAQAGWVEVLAGRSRFRIVSLDPKDYPELPLSAPAPAAATIKVAPGTLRDMIDKTLFAVSSDETRLNLSGVYLVGGEAGVLRMVATDGHRLAMIERKVAGAKLERSVILPRKGLVEARRLLDEAQPDTELALAVTAKDARIVAGDVSFFMRLVDARHGERRARRAVRSAAPDVAPGERALPGRQADGREGQARDLRQQPGPGRGQRRDRGEVHGRRPEHRLQRALPDGRPRRARAG
jgi:DNA polymerase III subunit beta